MKQCCAKSMKLRWPIYSWQLATATQQVLSAAHSRAHCALLLSAMLLLCCWCYQDFTCKQMVCLHDL